MVKCDILYDASGYPSVNENPAQGIVTEESKL